MEGFIPPLPIAFGIGRGELVRNLSLVAPRLTPEEIDALNVSTPYFSLAFQPTWRRSIG